VRDVASGQGATSSWLAGPAERPRPSGERGSDRLKKNKWAAAGPKCQMGQKRWKNSFSNKI
jgi:hypothetical protein